MGNNHGTIILASASLAALNDALAESSSAYTG
jgi:hypothetical protein